MSQRTFLNWSTGKDSALALHYLQNDDRFEVEHLLTTVNAHYDRVTMHGLSRGLLETQVESIGLPFSTVELPKAPDMETYGLLMQKALKPLQEKKFQISAFGDIFLEDLRAYRETQLKKLGFEAAFPLWKKDTKELIKTFIQKGFKAIVIAINTKQLDASFLGRIIDEKFITDLPKNVDPCGENGEFHTFCYDGPIFSFPVPFEKGETHFRDYPSPIQNEVPITFGYLNLHPHSP